MIIYIVLSHLIFGNFCQQQSKVVQDLHGAWWEKFKPVLALNTMLNKNNVCLVICSLCFIRDLRSLNRGFHADMVCHFQPLFTIFIMKPSRWQCWCCQISNFSYESHSIESSLQASFYDRDSLSNFDSCRNWVLKDSDPHVNLYITHGNFDKWQSVSVIAHSARSSSGEWIIAVCGFSFESFPTHSQNSWVSVIRTFK